MKADVSDILERQPLRLLELVWVRVETESEVTYWRSKYIKKNVASSGEVVRENDW